MGRGRPFKCPFCGSSDSASKGVRRTATIGVRRVRLCKGCGRKFTPRNQKPLAMEKDPAVAGRAVYNDNAGCMPAATKDNNDKSVESQAATEVSNVPQNTSPTQNDPTV